MSSNVAAERRLQRAGAPDLHVRRWEPAAGARSEVLLVHGLGEHAGRYAEVAARLVADGHGVTAPDLRGHGLSAGRRGHVGDWRDYLDDVAAAAAGLEAFHLLGHSMGGLVAADFVLADPSRVRKLLLSAPLLGMADPPPPWLDWVGRLLARVWPTKSMRSTVDPARLSRDPASVAAYRSDPLVFAQVTSGWYVAMTAALERVHANAATGRCPLRLLLPGDDLIVDAAAARPFAQRWSGPSEVLDWPAGRHELFHEVQPDRGEALEAVAAFFANEA